jgi:hypothetical protein
MTLITIKIEKEKEETVNVILYEGILKGKYNDKDITITKGYSLVKVKDVEDGKKKIKLIKDFDKSIKKEPKNKSLQMLKQQVDKIEDNTDSSELEEQFKKALETGTPGTPGSSGSSGSEAGSVATSEATSVPLSQYEDVGGEEEGEGEGEGEEGEGNILDLVNIVNNSISIEDTEDREDNSQVKDSLEIISKLLKETTEPVPAQQETQKGGNGINENDINYGIKKYEKDEYIIKNNEILKELLQKKENEGIEGIEEIDKSSFQIKYLLHKDNTNNYKLIPILYIYDNYDYRFNEDKFVIFNDYVRQELIEKYQNIYVLYDNYITIINKLLNNSDKYIVIKVNPLKSKKTNKISIVTSIDEISIYGDLIKEIDFIDKKEKMNMFQINTNFFLFKNRDNLENKEIFYETRLNDREPITACNIEYTNERNIYIFNTIINNYITQKYLSYGSIDNTINKKIKIILHILNRFLYQYKNFNNFSFDLSELQKYFNFIPNPNSIEFNENNIDHRLYMNINNNYNIDIGQYDSSDLFIQMIKNIEGTNLRKMFNILSKEVKICTENENQFIEKSYYKPINNNYIIVNKIMGNNIPFYLNDVNFIKDEFTSNDKKYYLVGIIYHRGSNEGGGHYVSYVKHKNIWYRCDDSKICPHDDSGRICRYVDDGTENINPNREGFIENYKIKGGEIKKLYPYMLFYSRNVEKDGSVRDETISESPKPINNSNNSCFINALMQVLFNLKEFTDNLIEDCKTYGITDDYTIIYD